MKVSAHVGNYGVIESESRIEEGVRETRESTHDSRTRRRPAPHVCMACPTYTHGVVLPNSVALFQRFQTQNREYLDNSNDTLEKLNGFELGAPPHVQIR